MKHLTHEDIQAAQEKVLKKTDATFGHLATYRENRRWIEWALADLNYELVMKATEYTEEEIATLKEVVA